MNPVSLAKSYLVKARSRLEILPVLKSSKNYSDVVRESQEIVELATKGMLRAVGIDPPKFHDVSDLLLEYRDRFSKNVSDKIDEIAKISKRLRKERELAFYGDIDFIPTEEYIEHDAIESIEQAKFVVDIAEIVIQ